MLSEDAARPNIVVDDFAYQLRLDALREAGVSFLGLSGRGAVGFLDEEILRGAKLIALLNDEGMRN